MSKKSVKYFRLVKTANMAARIACFGAATLFIYNRILTAKQPYCLKD